MKGMILAAGVGSRLSPITGVIPKPMVPVVNRPVMEHVLAMLVRAGITDIKANLHHLPHVVEAHFGNGSRWGANLSYSLERTLLGTAGAVKRVERFFDDTFVVVVADSAWDIDVREVVEYHRQSGAVATVAVKRMPQQALHRFGVVECDEKGRILRFQEKPRPEEAFSDLASTGLYVLEPEVLKLIPPGEFFDFARDLFPRLLENNLPFHAFLYDGPWSDIGTFDEYAQVHHRILQGEYSTLRVPGRRLENGAILGHHVRIHPEAVVHPPVLLGDFCQVRKGAEVGPNTVVGNHSIIGEGARVAQSVVGEHTYVGNLIELDGCLAHGKWLVKLQSGTAAYMDDDAWLADPHTAVSGRLLRRALDVTIGGLGLVGAMPLFLGLGIAARLAGRRVIKRTWHLAPDPHTVAPTGTAPLRPFQLLRFNDEGPMGMLIERLGIARVPALYNVVRGDISLVGTKPLTEEEIARVPEEWRVQLQRVPAGFTGMWRLQGDEDTPLDEVLPMDALYAATRSTWSDLQILWRSAKRRRS